MAINGSAEEVCLEGILQAAFRWDSRYRSCAGMADDSD